VLQPVLEPRSIGFTAASCKFLLSGKWFNFTAISFLSGRRLT